MSHLPLLPAIISFVNLSLVPLLVVETSPESLTTSPNTQFSVSCTARAEVDGQSIPVDIEWIRIAISPPSCLSQLMPTLYTTTTSPEKGYQSVLTTSENDNINSIIVYGCNATTTSSYFSLSETTIAVIESRVIPSPSPQCNSNISILSTVTAAIMTNGMAYNGKTNHDATTYTHLISRPKISNSLLFSSVASYAYATSSSVKNMASPLSTSVPYKWYPY